MFCWSVLVFVYRSRIRKFQTNRKIGCSSTYEVISVSQLVKLFFFDTAVEFSSALFSEFMFDSFIFEFVRLLSWRNFVRTSNIFISFLTVLCWPFFSKYFLRQFWSLMNFESKKENNNAFYEQYFISYQKYLNGSFLMRFWLCIL